MSTTLALVALPSLVYYGTRIWYTVPIDYNEGWNVIHTSRLLSGEALYLPYGGLPVIPVNYPPLSFVVIGTANYLFDNLLVTGRIVSFFALLLIAYFIFQTIWNLTSSRSSALLGAILWLAFMVHAADLFIGMDDPQLLAQVFSTSALCLASRSIAPSVKRTCVVAFLCCIALFTKHVLVAVPIAIAIAFFFADRKTFWRFAAVGVTVSGVLFCGLWLYGGEHFFLNFIDFDRPASNLRRVDKTLSLLLGQSAWVFFVPLLILFVNDKNKWRLPLIYSSVSFALAVYFSGGVDVDVNAWFDFFIAGSILFGLLAGSHSHEVAIPKWRVAAGFGLFVSGLIVAFYIGFYGGPESITPYALRMLQIVSLSTGVMLLIGQRYSSIIGWVFVVCGVIANESVVARYISSDGLLNPSTINHVRWLQLSLLSAGVVLAGQRTIIAALKGLFYRPLAAVMRMIPEFRTGGFSIAVYGIIVLGMLPMMANLVIKLEHARNYEGLERLEQVYRHDIKVLRSIQGPALFEDLLLGAAAGKELFFDPFSGSVLISSGRMPAEILTKPISDKVFSVIVTNSDVEKRLIEQRRKNSDSVIPAGYFNGVVLKKINENYQLLYTTKDNGNQQYRESLKTLDGRNAYQMFFYVPRTTRTNGTSYVRE